MDKIDDKGLFAQMTTGTSTDAGRRKPSGAKNREAIQLKHTYRIQLVFPEYGNGASIRELLEPFGYKVSLQNRAVHAIESAIQKPPDIILIDPEMSEMDGYKLCQVFKGNRKTEHIPIILVGGPASVDDKVRGYYAGAEGVMAWPIHDVELRARVRALVRTKIYHQRLRNEARSLQAKLRNRTRELEEINLGVVAALEKANSFNDGDTGKHIQRVCHYSRLLGELVGLGVPTVRKLFRYASLHDVGKVGVPDAILKKPGRLTDEEMEQMKKHTVFGHNLLREAKADQMACTIALRHHEKWDGSGYPDGLSGDKIPMEARIVAVADVFDAITTKRCYKQAWANDEALKLLQEQSGRHFDPRLVQLFLRNRQRFYEIQLEYADEPAKA